MTQTVIIVIMEELVTITIVAVEMVTYRRKSIEEKKLDLINSLNA